jgi:probable F420-dependent oxidoreductase
LWLVVAIKLRTNGARVSKSPSETASLPPTGTGIWSSSLRYGDQSEIAGAAAELEALGYTALWVPDVGGDVFGAVANLLRATEFATISTGILNLWMHSAEETAAQHAELTGSYGNRFLVGIGVSHAPTVEQAYEAGAYTQPLKKTSQFLDELDAAHPPLARDDRVIGAQGPKMLALAASRAAGVHPYLVTPEHTRLAREAVGPTAVVATEQGVVLETDPDRARSIIRGNFQHYIHLPNYRNNWMRLGFEASDMEEGGSNRLIDALVAWGDEEAIAARVQEHRDAGASHVCVQVLTESSAALPLDQWRRLAPALV